ncbi:unnamed protein product, partial [marine sediment metagenome]
LIHTPLILTYILKKIIIKKNEGPPFININLKTLISTIVR